METLRNISENWGVAVELVIIIATMYLILRRHGSQKWTRFFVVLSVLLIIITATSVIFKLKLIPLFVLVGTFFFTMSMIVVFQPELRRKLAELGSRSFFFFSEGKNKEFLENLTETIRQLGAKRYGALFAIERRIELKPHLETGIFLDAQFSSELILTIFRPKTELHDGGIILREGKVIGAGCLFPVSQREITDRSIGLRHRAGIGITEESDAIAIIVSEETGAVSIAHSGDLEHDLDLETFSQRLLDLLEVDMKETNEKKPPATAFDPPKPKSISSPSTEE
ncbi:MAG: TIGR00159 family protein [Verrucomicrobiales bacterium]|nr:TIGR00159 family protein [Verrucomicrobiales bacterium]